MRGISRALKRSVSAISDEIRLNSDNGKYDPIKAHHKAYVRRKYSKYQGMKIADNGELREFVEAGLYDDQSPPNIAGRIKKPKNIWFLYQKTAFIGSLKAPMADGLNIIEANEKVAAEAGGGHCRNN